MAVPLLVPAWLAAVTRGVKYRTIVADPPWDQPLMGKRQRTSTPKRPTARQSLAPTLPYRTMSLDDIKALPVAAIAESGAHLWLWTTNASLRQGFEVMEAWGFTYLAPITWVKPSGVGNYFVHRTQTVLFGYCQRCVFTGARYLPTVFESGWPPVHSQKPDLFYDLVERVSSEPRVELFARRHRFFWDVWGDESAKWRLQRRPMPTPSLSDILEIANRRRVELEQLHGELVRLSHHYQGAVRECDTKDTEIMRLRAVLTEIADERTSMHAAHALALAALLEPGQPNKLPPPTEQRRFNLPIRSESANTAEMPGA